MPSFFRDLSVDKGRNRRNNVSRLSRRNLIKYQPLYRNCRAVDLYNPRRRRGSAGAVCCDQVQVTETIRSCFTAATADDLDKLHAVIAPDFYAFEAGGRITGDALMEMLKAAHAAAKFTSDGKRTRSSHFWDIAWITYVNRGSIKDASGTKDVTWLESAVLQKEKGIWRIHFFHAHAPLRNNDCNCRGRN